MQLPFSPFQVVDWEKLPATDHPGETGVSRWRTVTAGDLRIRYVKYSAGYVADHWCERGHVVYVLEGELKTELRDGRTFQLTAGMSYHVSDGADTAHRSSSLNGAKLFIVD